MFILRLFMPLCFTSTKSSPSPRLCPQGEGSVIISEILWDIVFTELSKILCLTVPSEVLNYTSKNLRDIWDFSCVFCGYPSWVYIVVMSLVWVDLSKWTDMSSFSYLIYFVGRHDVFHHFVCRLILWRIVLVLEGCLTLGWPMFIT